MMGSNLVYGREGIKNRMHCSHCHNPVTQQVPPDLLRDNSEPAASRRASARAECHRLAVLAATWAALRQWQTQYTGILMSRF
jgi:pyruvate-formate lyase-activating enzyme